MLFGAFASLFCMGSSTIYHTFNVLSSKFYETLLKIDLIGIGIMIFSIAMALIYTGFHNYKGYGLSLITFLVLLMTINLIL